MKLLIFGHSHMWALRRAHMSFPSDGRAGEPEVVIAMCGTQEFPGALVHQDATGRVSLNSALLSALHRVGGDPKADVLVSCVQGNQYNAMGLLTDGAPFDVHPPGWPRPPRGDVPVLPYRAVSDTLMGQLAEFKQFLARLKTLRYRAIAHVCPPPPVPDGEFVRAALPPLPSGEKPDVSDAHLRLKLWAMQRDATKRITEEAGGLFLDPPEGVTDRDGFLARPYWKDSVHANADYGRLALGELRRAAPRFAEATRP